MDEQLAAKHAPIVMLKRQDGACDAEGEPYVPAPVEIVLGDPAVRLRLDSDDGGQDREGAVVDGPSAADLVGAGATAHLDLPGNPRQPGCDYERFSKERMEGQPAVAYARIVVSYFLGKVALQYWLYYVFNDFNNTHESDWEMIQLVFDAASVEEALGEEPSEVGFAQHGGGERADWDDDKLRREGSRPVIFAAAGSHATQYGDAVYLGWGENGTGFGCDDTTGPSVRVPLEARLVPRGAPVPDGPFAWLRFQGRWGEKQPWEYNGPLGPNRSGKWTAPFTWQRGLRESSLAVPAVETLGPAPTDFFCDVTELGSLLLTRWRVYPVLIPLGLLLAVAAAIGFLFVGWRTLTGAAAVYLRHARVFVLLGLAVIPVGIIANGVQYWVLDHPPGEQLFALMNRSPGARLAAALTVGGFQQLAGLIVVGPAVVEAVAEIRAGRSPGFVRAYRLTIARFRRLAVAVLRSVFGVGVLAISVVGIPWAVVRTVQWLFVAQAVVLDEAMPRQAAWLSARAVRGRWWRTAGIAVLLTVIAAAPGPVLGVGLLLFASASVGFVNGMSSLLYAATLPFSVIGFTLLYRDGTRRGRAR